MSQVAELLDALGLQYFASGEEYLLIFRGSALDHHVLVREGEHFLHATCVIGRAPESMDIDLAVRLLEWNTAHSLSRLGIARGELLILADLPLQGLQGASMEELVLSVASAAEQLTGALLPQILGGTQHEPPGKTPSFANSPVADSASEERRPAGTGARADLAPGMKWGNGQTPGRETNGDAISDAEKCEEEPEIDWESADI